MESNYNIRLNPNEELSKRFSVGTENIPPSYDSAMNNVQQPYTPVSGRSTPAYYSVPMEKNYTDCSTLAVFGLTPPESTFGGYYPSLKEEPAHYMGFNQFSESPNRRDSDEIPGIGFRYQQPLSLSVETADPRQLGRYPFLDQAMPSSLELPPIPYFIDNSPYDFTSMGWPMDEPLQVLATQDSPLNEAPLPNIHVPPMPISSAYQGRRLHVDEVQQKSTALQRVQQHRITKRGAAQPHFSYVKINSGLHMCKHPSCKDKKGFKRQEHLKRHENTVHYLIKGHDCPFCSSHNFNRDDNFRQHVTLHTIKGGTGRTLFCEGAQSFLDMLNARVKPRNVGNRKRNRRTKAASEALADQILGQLQPESHDTIRKNSASQAVMDPVLSQLQTLSQDTIAPSHDGVIQPHLHLHSST
ncbi:hypothetical protein F4782DRAFT_547765 [Xylaria castorea]|nr:hypothetical protein F4782DRAFT_547765 [Xylaria castorea]